MPRKPIKFELDFMIKDIFPRFTVKQFDDVSFNIKPLNQGLDYDTSNMIGKIFVGVNNDMFMQTTDITVSSDNINVLLDKNMLQKNGRAYAEIELTDEAGTITSSSFIFDIDPKIGEGGMIPGEYEGFVEKYERLISEFKAQINSSIDNSNNLIDKTIKNCNTSVDTKLSTVDSRLNSKVAEVDSKLDTVDRLITAKVSDFERRFSALTSSQQQNSEVIDAREGEVSLKARLDKDIENPKKLYTSIEGTEISVDSLEGYLKDIEILGNTVQDQDNLADIRSVGDKLENQELYEIPVLSTGKNLIKCIDHSISGGDRLYLKVNLNKNTDYRISSNYEGVFEYRVVLCEKQLDSQNRAVEIKQLNVQNERTFNTESNFGELYILFHFGNAYEKYQNNNINIQIEKGTQSTPYEPYVEDKLTILSPVQLEKVGDVADRIICKDGIWGVEKNINSGFIPSSAVWVLQRNNGAINRFACVTAHMPFTDFIRSTNNVISNKFIASVIPGDYIIGCSFGNNDGFVVHANIQDIPTLEDFKNFIGDGVFVKYATTQPTFIPLPHDQQIKLRTFANKTNISFGCEIEPTLKASVPKSLGASVSSNNEQIDILHRELDKIKNLLLQSEVVF